jgi:uncharacterized protein YdaU (DUF1376 family)
MTFLPYMKYFINDVVGECIAQSLGLREQGIVLRLFHAQHMAGGSSIPADMAKLRRLVGDDAKPGEIQTVVDIFFPLTQDRTRRANVQHAEAYAAAVHAYRVAVSKGRSGAEKRARHRTATGPATSPATSLASSPARAHDGPASSLASSNQNQGTKNESLNSTEGIPWEKKGNEPPNDDDIPLPLGPPDWDDDDPDEVARSVMREDGT